MLFISRGDRDGPGHWKGIPSIQALHGRLWLKQHQTYTALKVLTAMAAVAFPTITGLLITILVQLLDV